jgi:hypothetical protein
MGRMGASARADRAAHEPSRVAPSRPSGEHPLRYLSVCSGIEAATVAWHPLGWEAAAYTARSRRFRAPSLRTIIPTCRLHGDFTTIGADEYGPIDLLVGGTPCQSFSVAGLRGGIHDSRGNLALEYLRLLDRKRPRWMVWENVPGVYSATSDDAPDHSDDGDGQWEADANESHAFACFLAGLRNSGIMDATELWTLNTSEFHSAAVACSLSDILETGDVPRRFYLSATACRGILRRAEKRGRLLPPALEAALKLVAH